MASKRKQTQTGGREASTGLISGDYSLAVGDPETKPPDGWKWTKLSDLARLESGHTPSRKFPEYWDGDLCWIGIRDATANHGRIIYNTIQHTTKLGIENSSARLLPKHTVCLSRTASVGYVVVMGKEMATSQDFVNWVCSDELAHQFLKYILLSENRSFLRFASGTTHQTIYFPEVKAFHICHPPLPEQKAIAHILGTLDDKIELNRRMNETLEGMAQALFKSWFVDFDPVIDNALAAGNPIPEPLTLRAETRRKALDTGTANRESAKAFPDSFYFTEELGWIPEGWTVKSLDQLIVLIGGGTPKTSISEYWNGDIPWFSVTDAPNDSDIFVIDTEKKVTELGVAKSSTKILRKGTTIISARGTVGKCALVGFEMAMNQSCYAIQGADSITDTHTYFSIREYVADLQQRGHGSVFNTITRDTFKTISVPFGGTELTQNFESSLDGSMKRILANLIESQTLTKLRDTLLPKLISGELRIPQAEKMVEESLT
ncbi:restriction endonuclease subunit S [Akkermansiaceae bacterium]|nr:restriction endonuclease subunit S [Akkermansiaceae bacterium]